MGDVFVAPIWPLAWEPPYAVSVGLKKKKKIKSIWNLLWGQVNAGSNFTAFQMVSQLPQLHQVICLLH